MGTTISRALRPSTSYIQIHESSLLGYEEIKMYAGVIASAVHDALRRGLAIAAPHGRLNLLRTGHEEGDYFGRLHNLALLKGLPKKLWENYGVHQERGKESVACIVRLYAGHDLNHLAQVEKIAKQKS